MADKNKKKEIFQVVSGEHITWSSTQKRMDEFFHILDQAQTTDIASRISREERCHERTI